MATLSNVIRGVTENAAGRWVVLVVRVPAAPSRHRVAVWRELRRIGALSLGQGSWAMPDVPAVAEGITRVIELAERDEGEVVVLKATGQEIGKGKFILAELEEEEYSLERLRR